MAEAAVDKLELARGLLRRFEDRTGNVAAEEDGRTLPVAAPLARLLPAGGLRRGSTVAIGPGSGATSLLFALLAEASASGAWVAVVGRPDLGLAAAAEAGLRLDRLALVPHPGRDLLAVTVALLDGMDLVVVGSPLVRTRRAGSAPRTSRRETTGPGSGLRPTDRARLAARARQRGAVLVSSAPWPGADLELRCAEGRWEGLGAGDGRLVARPVRVELRARTIGAGRRERLLLPARTGAVAGRVVERRLTAAGAVPGRVSAAGVPVGRVASRDAGVGVAARGDGEPGGAESGPIPVLGAGEPPAMIAACGA